MLFACNMMKKLSAVLYVLALTGILFISCKKNGSTTTPVSAAFPYNIPATYNFKNVDFSDATTRLGMLTEINTVMRGATTGLLNAQYLKDRLPNINNRFTTAGYNASGLNIKNQSAALMQTDAVRFIDSLVSTNTADKIASRGVPGIGTSSTNTSNKFALTANGYNYAQVFAKTMMTGFIIYQIDNLLTAGANLSVDNTNIIAGYGTQLDHNWDLAFGYWGVPIGFPTDKTGAKFWGTYSTLVDSGYKANKILTDAYLKGRVAIDNSDVKTAIEQAAIIKESYEKLVGASALQAVRETKPIINDKIALDSKMSEIYGFVYGLKYLPNRKITDAQISLILDLFPKNFYDVTQTNINNIRDAIAAVYGFDSVKTVL